MSDKYFKGKVKVVDMIGASEETNDARTGDAIDPQRLSTSELKSALKSSGYDNFEVLSASFKQLHIDSAYAVYRITYNDNGEKGSADLEVDIRGGRIVKAGFGH